MEKKTDGNNTTLSLFMGPEDYSEQGKQATSHRLGKEAQNLMEFPWSLLARGKSDQNVISYSEKSSTNHQGIVTRTWEVLGDGVLGLPTAWDEDLCSVLQALTWEQNKFSDREVFFTVYDLGQRMGLKSQKWLYQNVRDGLNRLKGTTIKADLALYDPKLQEHFSHRFNILDDLVFAQAKKGRTPWQQHEECASSLKWNERLFETMATYGMTTDLDFLFSVPSGKIRRLAKFLLRQRYSKQRRDGNTSYSIGLRKLCHGRIGFSQNMDDVSRLKAEISKIFPYLELANICTACVFEPSKMPDDPVKVSFSFYPSPTRLIHLTPAVCDEIASKNRDGLVVNVRELRARMEKQSAPIVLGDLPDPHDQSLGDAEAEQVDDVAVFGQNGSTLKAAPSAVPRTRRDLNDVEAFLTDDSADAAIVSTLRNDLVRIGVNVLDALILVRDHREEVERQIKFFPYHDKKLNPGGWMVRAINGKFGEPPASRAAMKKVQEAQERQRRQEAAEEAGRRPPVKQYGAYVREIVSAHFLSLSADAQAEVDKTARDLSPADGKLWKLTSVKDINRKTVLMPPLIDEGLLLGKEQYEAAVAAGQSF